MSVTFNIALLRTRLKDKGRVPIVHPIPYPIPGAAVYSALLIVLTLILRQSNQFKSIAECLIRS